MANLANMQPMQLNNKPVKSMESLEHLGTNLN